jgi:hypothetical protein
MSGLLDKANETAKAAEKEEKVEESSVVIEPELSDNGLNVTRLKFQIGSVIGFVITMILVFFVDSLVLFGDITLDDLFVPGIVIFWLLFNGSELMEKDFDTTKLGVSAVAFLVLTAIFAGAAIFTSSDTGVTIANVEYDGDDNEIDLDFYGPSGMEYTVEVLVDGKVEYSHSDEINIDKGTHSVSLDDFWKGNAQDMNGDDLIDYEIKVTSDGGEDSMTFDGIMNREVDTAFIKVIEVFDTETSGAKTYTGITVEMIVGMGTPVCDPPVVKTDCSEYQFSADYFSGTTPQPIASDWTASVVVKFGSSVRYQYNSFTADEGIVNGLGEFRFDWVMLPGTSAGDLDRSDFYQDDGCYTFEVTIENENGDTHVDSSSKIEFFWDSNEATDDDTDDSASSANC